MLWWGVFGTLYFLWIAGTELFVPLTHRTNYANCRKDWFCWLAFALQQGVWMSAAVQNLVAPSIPPPNELRILGAVLFASGCAMVIAARRVNFWFLPIVIYVPPSMRCMNGIYSRLDHPGYLGFALIACGMFFLLGQILAFFPTLAYLFLLWTRIRIENRVLSQ